MFKVKLYFSPDSGAEGGGFSSADPSAASTPSDAGGTIGSGAIGFTEPSVGASTPQASSPSPNVVPGPGAFDYRAFAAAIAEANRPLLERFAPKPPEQPKPWQDKAKFWSLPAQGSQEAFHERIEQFVGHAVEQAIAPIKQENEQLRAALGYLNVRAAPDPGFAQVENDVMALVTQGVPFNVARELADLRRLKQTGGGGQNPQLPASAFAPGGRPVPVPPAHATTPNTRQSGFTPPRTDGKPPDIAAIAEAIMRKQGLM